MQGQWEKNKRPSKNTHNCITKGKEIYLFFKNKNSEKAKDVPLIFSPWERDIPGSSSLILF